MRRWTRFRVPPGSALRRKKRQGWGFSYNMGPWSSQKAGLEIGLKAHSSTTQLREGLHAQSWG